MSQDTTDSSAVESISALDYMTALLSNHNVMQIDQIGIRSSRFNQFQTIKWHLSEGLGRGRETAFWINAHFYLQIRRNGFIYAKA